MVTRPVLTGVTLGQELWSSWYSARIVSIESPEGEAAKVLLPENRRHFGSYIFQTVILNPSAIHREKERERGGIPNNRERSKKDRNREKEKK